MEQFCFHRLSAIQQQCLVSATIRTVSRARANPDLWEKVQRQKEAMYADGRLKREVQA